MVVAMKRACWAFAETTTEDEKAPFRLGLALRHKLPMSSARRRHRRDDVNNPIDPIDAVDAVDMIGSSGAGAVSGSINTFGAATPLTRHDGGLCPWHMVSGSSSHSVRSRLIRTVITSLWSGLEIKASGL